MSLSPAIMLRSLTVMTASAFVACAALTLWYAPVDFEMGPVQKLVYLHIPAAITAFVGAMCVFVAGVAYLWSRDDRWDGSARAAAMYVVASSAVVLITGMIWGHSFWGYWWTWSPRLTFTLVLFALYLGYLIVRRSIRSTARRRVAAAAYGLIAFLDVPLLYLSARLLPDVHPTSVPLTDPMRTTLAFCFVPAALLLFGAFARPWFRAHTETHSRPGIGIHPDAGGPRVA